MSEIIHAHLHRSPNMVSNLNGRSLRKIGTGNNRAERSWGRIRFHRGAPFHRWGLLAHDRQPPTEKPRFSPGPFFISGDVSLLDLRAATLARWFLDRGGASRRLLCFLAAAAAERAGKMQGDYRAGEWAGDAVDLRCRHRQAATDRKRHGQ
jgi:hypothetical protein